MKNLILLASCIAFFSCTNSPNLFHTKPKVAAAPTEEELFNATALSNRICPIDGKVITVSSHYIQVIVNEKSFRLCSKEDVAFFHASPERYLHIATNEWKQNNRDSRWKSQKSRLYHHNQKGH